MTRDRRLPFACRATLTLLKQGATKAKSSVAARPNKPRHDFPLTPREHGRWCKLVHVKLHYFTSTAQEGARQMAACKRRPACRSHTATQNDFRPTIADVLNPFLAFKKSRMVGGAITM